MSLVHVCYFSEVDWTTGGANQRQKKKRSLIQSFSHERHLNNADSSRETGWRVGQRLQWKWINPRLTELFFTCEISPDLSKLTESKQPPIIRGANDKSDCRHPPTQLSTEALWRVSWPVRDSRAPRPCSASSGQQGKIVSLPSTPGNVEEVLCVRTLFTSRVLVRIRLGTDLQSGRWNVNLRLNYEAVR